MSRRRKAGDPGRVVAYVRVSTDSQQHSPDAQRERLERWCSEHERELVALHVDEAISGAAEIEARPGLMAALAELGAQRAGVLLVTDRSRIARDPVVARTVERLAEEQGARVVDLELGEGAVTEGPTGRMVKTILDAVHELERSMIARRTRNVLASRRAAGQRTNSTPSYGYSFDGDRVVENPTEQAVLKKLRTWRRRGLSIRRCRELLEEKNIPARGKRWHTTTVARLVRRIEDEDA